MIGTLSLASDPLSLMAEPSSPGAPPAKPSSASRGDAESSLDLLVRAKTGDANALDELCRRYLPRLQRWAHGRLPAWARDGLDTHDLVQDTLAQVLRRLHAFNPQHEGAFQGYVRQTLLNRIRDEIRRAKRRSPASALDSDQPASEASPLEEAIGQEVLEQYEAALQRLRPEEREAIIARIEMGLTPAEVAEALGKPSAAAAHMAVSRALVRLAQEMSRGRRI
jgi:RNA polymerase sigma-70 factor, ECF subfamily